MWNIWINSYVFDFIKIGFGTLFCLHKILVGSWYYCPFTFKIWLLLKSLKSYFLWHSGLSSRFSRAIHTWPSSLVILSRSSAGTSLHVPSSNFLSLPTEKRQLNPNGIYNELSTNTIVRYIFMFLMLSF